MDPASDPEFSKTMQDNLGRLREQYEGVLEQVRDELKRMLEQRR
jgi:HEAT repeat protein